MDEIEHAEITKTGAVSQWEIVGNIEDRGRTEIRKVGEGGTQNHMIKIGKQTKLVERELRMSGSGFRGT